ncbi:MAG: hypothetical protein KDB27_26875 [Planctomycetales bacterium]|nr:hypothetical protein [Planctomycetales bacterium]
MSSSDASDAIIVADPIDESKTRSFLNQVESVLINLADYLNPILVKEARQALKSRSFTFTFTALLICAWGWSFLGTIAQMPRIYYAPSGLSLLAGYYVILAVPMLIIVPYSAFRSLSSEREDGTYELLSITTLSSRQIVTGKLGSAILQMIVYYSVLAPCMTFTFLLRGVDMFTIFMFLFYTFLASILFSAIGLMMASLSAARAWQMLMTVVLLFALVFGSFVWFVGFFEILDEMDRAPYGESGFWIGNAALLSGYATFLAIVILVAAGQNSFAGDNRSTRVRIAIFIQAILFAGWVSYGAVTIKEEIVAVVMSFFAFATLFVYGIFLTGESGVMSPRVKRSLPKSFLGRMLFTWFNPGSGTGYIFSVCHAVGIFLFTLALSELGPAWANGRAVPGYMYDTMFLSVGYFIFYLGLSRLVLIMVPHREQYGPALPFLLHIMIPFLGVAIPFVIQGITQRMIGSQYSYLQVTNWMWTLVQSADHGLPVDFVPGIVGSAAALVFVINLISATREIEAVRLDTPDRVKEDNEASK